MVVQVPRHLVELLLCYLAPRISLAENLVRLVVATVVPAVVAPSPPAPTPEGPPKNSEREEDQQERPEDAEWEVREELESGAWLGRDIPEGQQRNPNYKENGEDCERNEYAWMSPAVLAAHCLSPPARADSLSLSLTTSSMCSSSFFRSVLERSSK